MTQPLNRSSGDVLADRRRALAEGYLSDGDAAAAVDLMRQAVDIAPGWAAGWFRLGEMLEERLADRAGAAEAFRAALRLDREDVLGAGARLDRLVPGHPQAGMSPAYVAQLFDQYAPRFDAHLVGALGYRGPEIIIAALAEVCAALGRPMRFAEALDLGCGTGLMGRAIRAHADAVDGVDLSPEMARMARATGAYRRVWVGDAALAVAGGDGEARAYPLILAADVICYMRDLDRLFRAVAQAIPPAGLFAFTAQSHEGEGVVMGDDLRYHHAGPHIRDCAAAAGLCVLRLEPCVTRRDGPRDVPGVVAVLGRADG